MALPAVTLTPGQFGMVWASAKNRTKAAAPLHTNFKLDRGGRLSRPARRGHKPRLRLHQLSVAIHRRELRAQPRVELLRVFRDAHAGRVQRRAFPGPHRCAGVQPRTRFLRDELLARPCQRDGRRDDLLHHQWHAAITDEWRGVYSPAGQITNTTVLRAAAFAPGLLPSDTHTHSFLFTRDIIRQPDGVPPPGWPATWGANAVDYGMDPNVVNDPRYSASIEGDLRAMPSLCIVMELPDLFDPTLGIYANPGEDGIAWERPPRSN